VEFTNGVPSIKIYNFGCVEENASQNLYFNDMKSRMASLLKRNLRLLDINFEVFESLEIRRLDIFLINSSFKPVGFKIDVEGH